MGVIGDASVGVCVGAACCGCSCGRWASSGRCCADVVVDTVVVVHAAMVGGDAWHSRGLVGAMVDVVTVIGSGCGQLAGRGSNGNVIEPFRQLQPPWRQCGRAMSGRCCAVGWWTIVGGSSSSRKWFALARLVV